MNAGIATFHHGYNYGATLQEYALFTAVEQMGHTAHILDIPLPATRNGQPHLGDYLCFDLGPYRYARRAFRVTVEFALKPFKQDTFLAFEQAHLRMGRLPGELGAPAYGALICGSDQVWNPQITDGDSRFFLRFDSPATKTRIAYAPSFGARDEVPESFLPALREYLQSIDILSCREQEGAETVEELTQRPCPRIPDPVMLLTPEDWSRLARPPRKMPAGKYIFCYDMRRGPLIMDAAHALEAQSGGSLYYLEGFRGKKGWRSPVGPAEFLWLIQHAETVITNSFHASVFSVLFQKPLRVVYPATMITRLKELLERLHLKHLLVSTVEDAARPAPWDAAATVPLIAAERALGRNFLQRALEKAR
ncbi:MAG: polysaccharide pyruvyl transferase family protein [Chthoniobacteraceae bacterium]|nr:polysaccharide pyruvyl transferase family protein [Chthoniobacteraceae bacterium]